MPFIVSIPLTLAPLLVYNLLAFSLLGAVPLHSLLR